MLESGFLLTSTRRGSATSARCCPALAWPQDLALESAANEPRQKTRGCGAAPCPPQAGPRGLGDLSAPRSQHRRGELGEGEGNSVKVTKGEGVLGAGRTPHCALCATVPQQRTISVPCSRGSFQPYVCASYSSDMGTVLMAQGGPNILWHPSSVHPPGSNQTKPQGNTTKTPPGRGSQLRVAETSLGKGFGSPHRHPGPAAAWRAEIGHHQQPIRPTPPRSRRAKAPKPKPGTPRAGGRANGEKGAQRHGLGASCCVLEEGKWW